MKIIVSSLLAFSLALIFSACEFSGCIAYSISPGEASCSGTSSVGPSGGHDDDDDD